MIAFHIDTLTGVEFAANHGRPPDEAVTEELRGVTDFSTLTDHNIVCYAGVPFDASFIANLSSSKNTRDS